MKDKFERRILILTVILLALALLPQYQRPVVETAIISLLGYPPVAKTPFVPKPPEPPKRLAAKPVPQPAKPKPAPKPQPGPVTTTVAAPAKPAPQPSVRLPRSYNGIKFLSAYPFVMEQVMDRYKPLPRGRKAEGDFFRVVSEGRGTSAGTKRLVIEYLGDPAAGQPRYLTFLFNRDKLVKVIAKYFQADAKAYLKGIIDAYGRFRSHNALETGDEYVWDDGGMQLLLVVEKKLGAVVIVVQMEKFADLQ